MRSCSLCSCTFDIPTPSPSGLLGLSQHLFLGQLVALALGALVGGGEREGFLGAPFDALGSVGLVLALIADLGQLGARIDAEGAEIARLDAPGAPVAPVGIHADDAAGAVLGEGFPRAGDHAGGIFAGAAGDGRDQDLVGADGPDAAAVGIELTGLGVGADILAQLAAHTILG